MAKPTPAANATTTTFQIGTYNPINETANSDGFTLGLDMNDGATWQLMPGTLSISREEQDARSDNLRTPGEYVVANQYKNMHISASFSLSRKNDAAGTAQTAMLAQLRTLLPILKNPPLCIRIALPYATQYSYADVVKVVGVDKIPLDPRMWSNKALIKIDLVFECAPGFRGDRVTLSNLVPNPGFEAPFGGGTAQSAPTVFADGFVNASAYTSVGTAASVAANQLTIPNGTRVTFGSPAWSAIQQWKFRFQFVTGLVFNAYLHFVDSNNSLYVAVTGTSLTVNQQVAGTAHQIGTTSAGLTNGNFYWLVAVQFPSVNGNPPYVVGQLYLDSAGSIGALANAAGGGAFDAVTALVGQPSILAGGANLVIGGNFAGVHTVALFGPGGWGWNGANGGTALGAGAWDGTRTELGMSGTATLGVQTYGGGPVTSFGALRIDYPPAGTFNGFWENYSGGTAAGSNAMTIAFSGDTLGVAAYVKSSGLSQSAAITMQIREWNSSGVLLRATTVQSVSGNQASWTKLSGTVTTGASCAYASLLLLSADSTTGSVNGTVWFDNTQVWNQTRSAGQTSMPYCELRFPNSAAQFIVSGLVGDMIAPAYFAFGAYVPSWIPGATNLTWVFGRQAVFQNGAAQTAQACGRAIYIGSPTPTLDSTAYNGFYTVGAIVGGVAEYDGGPPVAMQGLLGTFHVFMRARSTQATIANVTVTAGHYQSSGTNGYATESSQVAPFAAANTWTAVDCGQMQVPASPYGGITGTPYSTNTTGYPRVLFRDPTGGGSNQWGNWWAAIPVDGSMVIGNFFNASNSGVTVTNNWVWGFSDPLALSGTGGSSAWRLTVNTGEYVDPTTASGGPNAGATQFVGINASGDAYITLDPVNGGGTNLVVGYLSDGLANVLATHVEMQYSPRYLAPR